MFDASGTHSALVVIFLIDGGGRDTNQGERWDYDDATYSATVRNPSYASMRGQPRGLGGLVQVDGSDVSPGISPKLESAGSTTRLLHRLRAWHIPRLDDKGWKVQEVLCCLTRYISASQSRRSTFLLGRSYCESFAAVLVPLTKMSASYA